MKLPALIVSVLICFFGHSALAEMPPRGSVLELHSCELYAGGCIVSSEATLGGRYMSRAWNVAAGTFQGTDLSGLNIAMLQASAENLATPRSEAGSVVVYLPDRATATQRDALLAWLRSTLPEIGAATDLRSRVVPIRFNKADSGYSLSVGEAISVQTAPLETCAAAACGEALWYTPRAQTSIFTVALDQSSRVREPLLHLRWDDAGRRSIFLGKFRENLPARDLYVSASDLCGPTDRLF